jgi:mRNA interferase MazF
VNVGDVHWVEFPPGGGHAQAGRRPAIVLQDASATEHLPTVLMVPLTTQLSALRFPGTVLVDADQENGLRRPSVAMVFQLTVVDRRFLGSRMGQVSSAVLGSIWDALDRLTGRAGD